MKKLSVVIVLMIIGIALVGFAQPVSAKVNKKKIGAAYAKVIERSLKEYNNDGGFDSFARSYSFYNGVKKPVYRITDWNGDGIPELFIGIYSTHIINNKYSSNLEIYTMYTYKNGKAKLVFEHQLYGGLGVPCYEHFNLLKGKVFSWQSKPDVSMYSHSYYKFTKKGTLKKIKVKNDNQPLANLRFYVLNKKCISEIKKGKFSYKEQKSYKYTTGY